MLDFYHAVAQKMTNNFWGLLFGAPCTSRIDIMDWTQKVLLVGNPYTIVSFYRFLINKIYQQNKLRISLFCYNCI